MINERESREVLMLTFRAARFGETELMKAIKAYIRHRQNAPPQHGKMKLKELMQRDQGATMMEIKSDAVKEFQRIAKKYNVDFIGNPQTDMRLSRDTYWKILRNQLILTGTWNSSFTCSEDDDWHYVVNRLQNHSIHPTAHITHKFGLETMDEGLSVMRDKDIYHCKVMIYM